MAAELGVQSGPRLAPGLRVVSLLPSCTDTVIALGMQHLLVGISHECEGEGVSGLPTCTSNKFDSESMTLADVDAASGSQRNALWGAAFGGLAPKAILLEWGLGCYRTDMAKLKELQPDVVLTQVQEGPQVLSRASMQEALRECLGIQSLHVVHSDPQTMEEVFADMRNIAESMQAGPKGQELELRLRRRVQAVRDCVRGRAAKRVACVQWTDPLYLAGGWVPELISMAGGTDIFATTGGPSIEISDEELVGSEVDVVVFAICGFQMKDTLKEVQKALARWMSMNNPPKASMIATDAVRMFSRPGPLLVDTLEMLVEILHPEAQEYGHRMHNWQCV
mmetsp:Transcript_28479/g.54321  ORF Transcript_28479/g.54321 Transcript_28479/m.54321 type:complete len:336 (+) Transcript_28479:133-1140(+)